MYKENWIDHQQVFDYYYSNGLRWFLFGFTLKKDKNKKDPSSSGPF